MDWRLRPSEICYRGANDTFSFVNLKSVRQFRIPKGISRGKDFGFWIAEYHILDGAPVKYAALSLM